MVALGLAACSGDAGSDPTASTVGVPDCNTTDTGDDPSVLNGVYQIDWSHEDLAEASGATEEMVEANDGVFTLTFSDGCFNMVWEDNPGHCAGAYTVTANRVSMVAALLRDDWGCGDYLLGDEFLDAVWELTEDQLTLSDFVSFDHVEPIDDHFIAVHLGTKPLVRVEGADSTTP